MGVSKPRAEVLLARLASGLEAGMVGGVAMLVLLIAGSMWRGEVWWAPANLLGSTFYGTRALRFGLGMATLSGAAFHFVITGTVGALFGLACGGVGERRRLVLLGTLAGVFWYYLADALLWKQVNPLVPVYALQPVTLIAHAVFGACLGYMGQRHLGQRHLVPGPPPLQGARDSWPAQVQQNVQLPSISGDLAEVSPSASLPPPLSSAGQSESEQDRVEIR